MMYWCDSALYGIIKQFAMGGHAREGMEMGWKRDEALRGFASVLTGRMADTEHVFCELRGGKTIIEVHDAPVLELSPSGDGFRAKALQYGRSCSWVVRGSDIQRTEPISQLVVYLEERLVELSGGRRSP